jgi:hypothetical protein
MKYLNINIVFIIIAILECTSTMLIYIKSLLSFSGGFLVVVGM